MACSHIQDCELFVQFALNPALDIWKQHFCEGSFESCSRYQISKTGRRIPLTLLPSGTTITQNQSSTEMVGSTAVFNAIVKNRLRMIQSLARVGVDLNCRNIEGQTPLMAAAKLGHLPIVQFLLDNGVDAMDTNDYGQNAMDIARKAGHAAVVGLLERRCVEAKA